MRFDPEPAVGTSGQLTEGSLLDRRRTELLVRCAHLLHAHRDLETLAEALAEQVCDLLPARYAVVLLREGDRLAPLALAGDDPRFCQLMRAAWRDGQCGFMEELAMRAITGRHSEVVPISGTEPGLPDFLLPGEMLAAPLISAEKQGAVLTGRGAGTRFQEEEAATLAEVGRLAALAISNAELQAGNDARRGELREFLEISSDLDTSAGLDPLLQNFLLRAARLLGFERGFVALADEASCQIRHVTEKGSAQSYSIELPSPFVARLCEEAEPFCSNDIRTLPPPEQPVFAGLRLRQLLAVPLLGSQRQMLGILGFGDHLAGQPLSAEDRLRARALGAELALALEADRNLRAAEQHRHRSEVLMSFALGLNSSLRQPGFMPGFARRAAEVLGARAVALALAHHNGLEIAVLQDPAGPVDQILKRRLSQALGELAVSSTLPVSWGPAERLLGPDTAATLGWSDVTVGRLQGAGGELLGFLCLADRGRELSPLDHALLLALLAHAAVALENARLFSRMEQANRHWIEIFDAITDLIVVHDEEDRILRVNRSMADFIGVVPSELIGLSMRALLAMAGGQSAQPCPFCRLGKNGVDEYHHPGLEHTYLVSTSHIRGALNDGAQVIHVLKDITDRREAERRYRELFDNIQEGLFFSTPEGRFIEVNDALVRMLGYDSREQLLQIDIPNQLYPSPEQRERFRAEMEQHGVLRNFEEMLRHRDGSVLHTLQNAFAVRDSQGRVVQYRGVILDVTEQKNYQSELQRQRDFNSKIIDNTQSMILVVDAGGKISFANRRCFEAGGYRPPELLGRPLIDLVAPGRRPALAAALEDTLAGKQVDNLELPVLLGEGRGGQFSVNLSPMRDEAGRVLSLVVVMTDITDSAMLQAKLMHTEKMAAVGRLVSGVAHEVNNPVTAILGFADLLLEQPDIPPAAKEDLRIIVQEAERTKQIVQNLLRIARPMPPQREAVALNTVLRRTLALRAYDFANHGVQVVEKLAPDLPDVTGDSHQLQQVFLNIINNAYDAVRDTGRTPMIEVASRCRQGFAEIIFRDNGHGVAYPDRIFDPFFTTKEVGKGTGLGLSICYGIVREHQGEIIGHNNPDGPGATFVVRLPVPAPPPAAEGKA